MKRILSLSLVALLILSLFVGCTNAPAAGATTTPQASASAAPTAETDPTDEGSLSGIYPIVTDRSVDFELWRAVSNQASAYITDLGNGSNYSFAELEKQTGIHVHFIHPTTNNAAEQFQVLVLSEDYPDAISGAGGYYTGGEDKAIEDGFIIRLNEYIEELCPNYQSFMNKSEVNRRACITDKGNMPSFGMAYDRSQPAFAGYAVRADLLEDMGMESPVTISGWYDMLCAFRDNYDTDGPLEMYKNGVPSNVFIIGAYGSVGTAGAANAPFIQKDNVVEYAPINDGYRQYLELMAKWYAEGLVDPDFITNGASGFGIFPNNTRVANNQDMVINCMYTYAGSYLADSGIAEAGANFTLLKAPTINEGDTLLTAFKGGEANDTMLSTTTGYAITSSCTQPDILCRYFDYFYSDEGMIITNYGVEGVTFGYNDDGSIYQYDLIAHNPDGLTTTVAQEIYLIHNGTGCFILDREEDAQSETALEYREVWAERGKYNLVGNLTLTPEEGSARSAIIGDANTYVDEFTCNVIIGAVELSDATWQSYAEKLKSMKIDEAVSITQAAYDRYLVR